MPRYPLWAAGLVLACACAASPALAQADNAAALAQLDASLPGTLINDPTSLDWKTQGENLRVSNITDSAIPGGGAAARYAVRRAGPNPWSVQVYVPLTAEIPRGETVTAGFWARTQTPPAPGQPGQVRLRFQDNVDPWPGFGDAEVAVGPEWKWYEVSAVAAIAVPARNATLVFQIGGARQDIEIGQVIVVKGAARIVAEGVRPPEPLPPQLEGKGTLVSKPDSRDWSFAGAESSRKEREDKTIWQGRAVRMVSPVVGGNAWDIQAQVPLTEAIGTGDRLLIAVAAKTVVASTDDGKAVIGIRVQQAAAPYAGFADNTFKVGPNWQLIQIQTTATADLAAGEALVALHLSGARQEVDLGPVYVLKLPAAP